MERIYMENVIRIIKPKVVPVLIEPYAYEMIERAGRTCYKSEKYITEGSAKAFCEKIMKLEHTSVLEFAKATFRIICDRGVSHELVRHRLASFCQESTRYCSYKNKPIAFIQPYWLDSKILKQYKQDENSVPPYVRAWIKSCSKSASTYRSLMEAGLPAQAARAVLNNSLKTEVVMSANFREWLHFLKLRTSTKAHPDMQIIANLIKAELVKRYPIIFDNEK